MSGECWKCGKYSKDGGLCDGCSAALDEFIFYATLVIVVGFVYLIIPIPITPPWYLMILLILFRIVVAGVATVIGGLALVAVIYSLLSLLRVIGHVGGWILAIGKRIKNNYQRKLHEDAVQRAKLSQPTHLTGQQLDALLTQQHEEKMGWK